MSLRPVPPTLDEELREEVRYLTKREAADRARLSERTLERAIARGELRASGGRARGLVVRIRSDWLEQWLECRGVEV